MTKKPLLLAAISLLLLALVWLTVFWKPEPQTHSLADAIELKSPPTGGEFTVNTADGPLSLADLRDKAVILYFGYTLCPDICPTSLGFTGAALRQLSPQELAQVQTIFVSVDPDRDTLDHLKKYAEYFHPSIIGATESKDVIDKIVEQYGASYRMVETESSLKYLVDHSASIYLIDKQGKLVRTLAHGTLPEEIVKALREVL